MIEEDTLIKCLLVCNIEIHSYSQSFYYVHTFREDYYTGEEWWVTEEKHMTSITSAMLL